MCEEVFEIRYGITAFWTGVGCLYPRDLHVCKRGIESLRSSKVEMLEGTVLVVFSFLTDDAREVEVEGEGVTVELLSIALVTLIA